MTPYSPLLQFLINLLYSQPAGQGICCWAILDLEATTLEGICPFILFAKQAKVIAIPAPGAPESSSSNFCLL